LLRPDDFYRDEAIFLLKIQKIALIASPAFRVLRSHAMTFFL
jgi:hypothetical protein